MSTQKKFQQMHCSWTWHKINSWNQLYPLSNTALVFNNSDHAQIFLICQNLIVSYTRLNKPNPNDILEQRLRFGKVDLQV